MSDRVFARFQKIDSTGLNHQVDDDFIRYANNGISLEFSGFEFADRIVGKSG
jgi:hypothetical protein